MIDAAMSSSGREKRRKMIAMKSKEFHKQLLRRYKQQVRCGGDMMANGTDNSNGSGNNNSNSNGNDASTVPDDAAAAATTTSRPSLTKEDAENYELLAAPTEILQIPPCFACDYVGELLPEIKGKPLEVLIRTMVSGERSSSMARHCLHISELYENTIRKPCNANLKIGQMPLPEWPPSMVLEHLTRHHNDPELTAGLMLKKLSSLFLEQYENGLVEIDATLLNAKGEPLKTINHKKWRVVKEILELWIKMGKSRPDKMHPFYHPSRFEIKKSVTDNNPLINMLKKKIV
jgi:hypothetical protein